MELLVPVITLALGLALGHWLTVWREGAKKRDTRRETARLLLAEWARLEGSVQRTLAGWADTAIPLDLWEANEGRIVETFGEHVRPALRFYHEARDLEEKRRAAVAEAAQAPPNSALRMKVWHDGGVRLSLNPPLVDGIKGFMAQAKAALEEAAK